MLKQIIYFFNPPDFRIKETNNGLFFVQKLILETLYYRYMNIGNFKNLNEAKDFLLENQENKYKLSTRKYHYQGE